jgi:hypothetical protein
MASNINSADVDALYPIAGQDNDSQGFRDNFSTIKNSLATASTEITALQDKTAGVAATAIEENGSTVGGDWNGYYIQDANFRANVEEVYSIGNALTSLNVNWTNGHYQTIKAGADDITCTLAEWPTSGKLGKMRLAITGDGTPRTVTISATEMRNDGATGWNSTNSTSVSVVATSATAPHILEFWTEDSGLIVYAHYVGNFS